MKKKNQGSAIGCVIAGFVLIFIFTFLFGYSSLLAIEFSFFENHTINLAIYFIIIHTLLILNIYRGSFFSNITKYLYFLGNLTLGFYCIYYEMTRNPNTEDKIADFVSGILNVFSASFLSESQQKESFSIAAIAWIGLSLLGLLSTKNKCPECRSKKIELMNTELLNQKYEHETKTGNRDKRYGNNKLTSLIKENYSCLDCSHQWSKVVKSKNDEEKIVNKNQNNTLNYLTDDGDLENDTAVVMLKNENKDEIVTLLERAHKCGLLSDMEFKTKKDKLK